MRGTLAFKGLAEMPVLVLREPDMTTRKGVQLTEDLAKVLNGDAQAREAFEILRPSCQRDYAERVKAAKTPEMRERLLRRVIDLAVAYHKRHPNAGVRSRGTRLAS